MMARDLESDREVVAGVTKARSVLAAVLVAAMTLAGCARRGLNPAGPAFEASSEAARTTGGSRFAPVMPLASRLVLGAPAGSPPGADPARAAAAAELAHRADEAFGRADFAGACILGRAALERMPADSGGCTARAPLAYLIWKAACQGGCDQDEAAELLRTTCTRAKLPAPERAAQAFFDLLVELETKRGGGWTADAFPEEWAARKDRQAAMAALRKRTEPLTGKRRELILTLIEEIEAFALRPRGPCDDETPARRQAALAKAAERLFALGRADLSSYVPGGGPAAQAGKLDLDTLARRRTFALAPENLWRRKELLDNLLTRLWAAAKAGADQALAEPICRDYFDELGRRVAQDTWPDRADRNLGLLTGSFMAALACPDRTALQALFTRVLDQAGQGERGKLGVLVALASMFPTLFEAAISGQQDRLLVALEQMHAAVLARLGGLSDSLEDRALGASLQVFLALDPLLKGRTDEAVERVDAAERGLGRLPFPPPADAPLLVRLGPGLHLAAGYLLAGAYALAERDELVAPLLARMRPDIVRVLPYTLEALDAAAHARSVVAVCLALHGLLERLAGADGPLTRADLEPVVAGIERAWPELPARGGWWQVGLAAAELGLSDYLALAYSDELGPESEARLLKRSGTELTRLCERARAWFGLTGPDYDFVRLLPVAHAVLENAMALPADRADRLTAALLAVGPRLEKILATLAPERRPQARLAYLVGHGSLPGLAMEAVWIARELGWEKLVRAGAGASEAIAARLEWVDSALAEAGRVELKLLLDLVAGGLLQLAGRAELAQSWLARASGTMDEIDLSDGAPYVLAARAAIEAERDLPAARRLLREAMAPGREAEKCGRTHPVDALGLPQAWLSERSGEHELAMAQLAAYRQRVAAGFEGEGRVKCQYQFHGDRLVAQATVDVALSNLVQPTSNDSTFQVGAGASSVAVDRESLVCRDEPFGHRRHDRLLTAELTGAVYAMLHGDDPAADLFLRRALVVLERIDNGSRATLDAFDADGLEPAREKLYRPLLFWAGALAQLRGHTVIGAILERRAGRTMTEDREEQLRYVGLQPGEPPAYLGSVPGVERLRPLLERWYSDWVERKGPSEQLLARIAEEARRMPSIIPASSPTLIRATWLLGQGKAERASALIAASPPAHRRDRRFSLLEAVLDCKLKGSGPKAGPKAEGLSDLLQRAVAAGFLPEALAAAERLGPDLAEREGPGAAERLVEALRAPDPKALDGYSAGQADLLLARIYLKRGELARARELLIADLDRTNGLIPLQQQLDREQEVIFSGLRLALWGPTLERIQARLPLFGRAQGFDSATVLALEARALALRILLGRDYDRDQPDRLLARLGEAGAPAEAARRFLTLLKAALAAGADPLPACREFLKS